MWGNILCPEIDLHALRPCLGQSLFSCVCLHVSAHVCVSASFANKQSGIGEGLVWCRHTPSQT